MMGAPCLRAAQATLPGRAGASPHSTEADSESPSAPARYRLAGAYFSRAQYKIALDELRKAITADSRFGRPTISMA